MDISKPDQMSIALSRHFSVEETEQILKAATSPEYKKKLTDKTQYLIDNNAFGAPWYIVRNKQGKSEQFFGSDRSAYPEEICATFLILSADFITCGNTLILTGRIWRFAKRANCEKKPSILKRWFGVQLQCIPCFLCLLVRM
jgi:hypothetical protein